MGRNYPLLCPITGYLIFSLPFLPQSPTPPHVVYWRHKDRLLNYDTERGGVTVTMEHGVKTASRLVIEDAVTTDTGNYTCEAPNTQPALVHVFVSQGECRAECRCVNQSLPGR